MKLLLSGYYQTSAAQMRDGLETANLIDYFTIDPKLLSQWRDADDKERWKRFKPVAVRTALGKRDGTKMTERRDEVYKVFSTYASHANPKGVRLLRPTPNGLALTGPFYELTALTALFTEFAKNNVPSAMHLVRHFPNRTRLDYLTAIAFLELSDRWSAHFYATPYEPEKFAKFAITSGRTISVTLILANRR